MIVANALRLPYAGGSAHMGVTSPPYYQKRRYEGVEPMEWPAVSYSPMPGLPAITVPAVTREQIAATPEQVVWKEMAGAAAALGLDPEEALLEEDEKPPGFTPDQCAGVLGLEPDPFAYIGHLVLVAREVWRVLRDDGVFCVNIGDTYHGGGGGNYSKSKSAWGDESMYLTNTLNRLEMPGYKPKDLMGIPWRLAFALVADGWTLRSRMPGGVEMRPDVIWTKNAMPESVRDRPSVDFEDVFIFSKGLADRTIKPSHLCGESGTLREHLRPKSRDMWSRYICYSLASALLNRPETHQQLGLLPLDSQVGHQLPDRFDGPAIAGLPFEDGSPCDLAVRFLYNHIPAEVFLEQIEGFPADLCDRDRFGVLAGAGGVALAPPLARYTDATVAIQDSGHVCKFEILHKKIILSSPRKCTYCWDQENGRIETSPLTHWTYPTPYLDQDGNALNAATSKTLRTPPKGGANLRASWKINTEPTNEEHYAAWPRELVRRLIKIGTSDKGCCPECGAQWVRLVERGESSHSARKAAGWVRGNREPDHVGPQVYVGKFRPPGTTSGGLGWAAAVKAVGWAPGCSCGDGVLRVIEGQGGRDGELMETLVPVPCRVLDPFSGIGRTGEVCYETGRIYMPAELSVGYAAIQARRLDDHRAVRRGEALPRRRAGTISGPLFAS